MWIHPTQHATADVSLMLLASKTDLDSKKEVPADDGQKVSISGYLSYMY